MAANVQGTDYGGIGLGLAIVKSITQAHDGTLTLTPGLRAGSATGCNFPVYNHIGLRR